jgi:hypothetical protein
MFKQRSVPIAVGQLVESVPRERERISVKSNSRALLFLVVSKTTNLEEGLTTRAKLRPTRRVVGIVL